MRYAVFLRGVNLGGSRALAMADLRRALESLGYTGVATHLRSGNAVITTDDEDPDRVAATIHEALAAEVGLRSAVLVRTGPELAAVIKANPFPEHESEPAKLHVAFLSAQPSTKAFAALDLGRYAPDEARLGDRAIYLWFPNGAGRSKLGIPRLATMGVEATARNWNTVLALAAKTSP
ncbi:DUF1697 domain-containing protein [Actinomycetes bacterium KLBMP 9797]